MSAPTALPDPAGIEVVRVVTALEMRDAVVHHCESADALVMAAAVADWRPASTADRKVKKGTSDTWEIRLTRNPDILAQPAPERLIKVGFAAESEDLLTNARAKLRDKGLHLIAANDVGEGGVFGADTNKVLMVGAGGAVEELPSMSKYEVGHRILDRIAALLP